MTGSTRPTWLRAIAIAALVLLLLLVAVALGILGYPFHAQSRGGPTAPSNQTAEIVEGGVAMEWQPQTVLPQVSALPLLKNTGQTAHPNGAGLSNSFPARALGFATGTNARSYTLSSVDIDFKQIQNTNTAGNQLTVTLNDESDGNLGNALCTLANPMFTGSGVQTFTAPTTGTTCPILSPGATYFIVVSRTGSASTTVSLNVTETATADMLTPSTGWSFGDSWRQASDMSWATSSIYPMMEIKGTTEALPAHCDGTEIWCETLTVGRLQIDLGIFLGWNDGGDIPGASITGADFNFDGSDYIIQEITINPSGGVGLLFTRDGAGDIGSAATRHRFVLHADSTQLHFGSAIYLGTNRSSTWSNHGLTWTMGQEVELKIVEKHPATGKPFMSSDGPLEVGTTLTALTDGIADEDGPASPSFDYQWVRVDNGAETDIDGFTGSSYELAADDVGKQVQVRVMFTDDGGARETLTSDATAPVVAEAITLVSNTGQTRESAAQALDSAFPKRAQLFMNGSARSLRVTSVGIDLGGIGLPGVSVSQWSALAANDLTASINVVNGTEPGVSAAP